MKKIITSISILLSISSISFSQEAHKSEANQSKEKAELIKYFLRVSGDSTCSSLGQIYGIMRLSRDQPSTFALKIAKNETERKVWVNSLLDVQKYGYDSANCIAMYYGDISPKPFITGYHFYVMQKNVFSSQPYEVLKKSKESMEEDILKQKTAKETPNAENEDAPDESTNEQKENAVKKENEIEAKKKAFKDERQERYNKYRALRESEEESEIQEAPNNSFKADGLQPQ